MQSSELADYFPPSPKSVPAGLTAASSNYRRHVWLASLGLLAFVGLYLGLTAYLAWVVYRLLGRALIYGGSVGLALVTSLPAVFFLAFLVRGLFVVKAGGSDRRRELKRAEEPRLFAFLDRLADETGAPRPYRVFATPEVNASVFFDVSLLNLLWPTRKNLNLGLGLINVLTLDQLKAVIAHEYGHFAQRSMAVGRWVYVAQQATGQVIHARGGLDHLLQVISQIDLRVAWIGWIMRVFVWAIRALLDSAFRLVVLADRALGREMELQADRIAVSVSGSDSLVHALHRLGPADEAWEEAVGFALEELRAGRPVPDLFQLQALVLDHLRRILDQPEFGQTPTRPQQADQRVFADQLAHPPRMWLTHPPNREREEHAKAVYLPSTLDARPAWLLFARPEQTRREVTQLMFQELERKLEPKAPADPATTTVEQRLARRYGGRALDPRYRGVYLGRSVAAYHRTAREQYGTPPLADRATVVSALGDLYPEAIKQELKDYRDRREEERLLEGLSEGVLTAAGGTIRYRGQEVRRRELPSLISTVKQERLQVEGRIIAHDRSCRAAHLAAAELLGAGWPAYLLGLGELLHYGTHSFRNLVDAYGHLQHVIEVVTVDGHVSESERLRVLGASEDLQRVLEEIFPHFAQLVLPEVVTRIVEEEGGTPTLKQKLGLPMPSRENLGDWLGVIDGWARGAIEDLRVLIHAVLEALLAAEARVADAILAGESLEPAPAPGQAPSRYSTCAVGQERERQKKLGWWDRFQIADGVGPGLLRAGAAVGLLAPALFVGGTIGAVTIHVANGLEIPVLVKVDQEELIVPARSLRELSLTGRERVHLAAFRRVPEGAGRAIESLDVDLPGGFGHSVYNVGQAATFAEWTAVYGENAKEPPPRLLGAPRWFAAEQDVLFADPPASVQVKAGQTERRVVLEFLSTRSPGTQLHALKDDEQRRAFLRTHLSHDSVAAHDLSTWILAAEDVPERLAILRGRAEEGGSPVAFLRAVQDLLPPEERAEECERMGERARAEPLDQDLNYLALRCQADRDLVSRSLFAAWEQAPNHPWLSWAAADELAARGRYQEAVTALERVVSAPDTGSMFGPAASELLRTVRVAESEGQPLQVRRPLPSSPETRQVQGIEGPPHPDHGPTFKAYRSLFQGDLPQAIQLAVAGEPEALGEVQVLVGASDGAAGPLVEQALKVPAQQLGGARWVQDSLQIRVGEPPPALNLEVDWAGPLYAALVDPTLPKNPERLEVVAQGRTLHDRGTILAAGLIVLGERAPSKWRSFVRAALFPTERPYFHP